MRAFQFLVVALAVACNIEAFAQDPRIGISSYYYQSKQQTDGKRGTDNELAGTYSNRQSNTNLYYQWYLDSSRFMRTSIGYSTRTTTNKNDDRYGNGFRYENRSESSGNSYSLSLGIGKTIPVRSFRISAGVNMSGTVSPDQRISSSFSTSSSIYPTTFQEEVTKYPSTYAIGANLFIGADYAIWKKLSVGIEYGLGGGYTWQSGKSEGVKSFTDINGNRVTETFSSNIRNTTLGWGSVPLHINVFYNF
jgi:hypothetical protein